jgi:uncharacterized sporulation protein YeaH/YhbH (DUF444 family)
MAWTDQRLDSFEARVDAGFERVNTDIRELRTELKGDITELRTELKGDISKLDVKFDGLDAKFDAKFNDLHRVLLQSCVAVVVALVGVGGVAVAALLGA